MLVRPEEELVCHCSLAWVTGQRQGYGMLASDKWYLLPSTLALRYSTGSDAGSLVFHSFFNGMPLFSLNSSFKIPREETR